MSDKKKQKRKKEPEPVEATPPPTEDEDEEEPHEDPVVAGLVELVAVQGQSLTEIQASMGQMEQLLSAFGGKLPKIPPGGSPRNGGGSPPLKRKKKGRESETLESKDKTSEDSSDSGSSDDETPETSGSWERAVEECSSAEILDLLEAGSPYSIKFTRKEKKNLEKSVDQKYFTPDLPKAFSKKVNKDLNAKATVAALRKGLSAIKVIFNVLRSVAKIPEDESWEKLLNSALVLTACSMTELNLEIRNEARKAAQLIEIPLHPRVYAVEEGDLQELERKENADALIQSVYGNNKTNQSRKRKRSSSAWKSDGQGKGDAEKKSESSSPRGGSPSHDKKGDRGYKGKKKPFVKKQG
jgi:hypothetical protein